jgi:RNA polymerase sigma factor (sigma-70 family)
MPPSHDFSDVYEEHVWRVYGFFAYRLNSRQDAEDLTQYTFERAWRAWGRYDPARASVLTWLLAIARNLLVDHRRSTATSRERTGEEGELDAVAAEPDQFSLGLEPELEVALAELSPRERELIAMRFGADLTGPEIAELTGLTLANVQQILSRTLRRMRATIEASRGAADTRSVRVG